jgi:hypothetical protein
MSENSVERLEIRALQQRNDIHEAIGELKDKVLEVRSKLDPNANAREHLLAACVIVSSIGFLAGHAFAGMLLEREQAC